MRVVLVTHDAIFGRFLAARLHSLGAVDRVVVESRAAPPRFYWRKLKRVGVANAAFQYALNRRIRTDGARVLGDAELPRHERVASVNDCQFAENELIIGFGTSIVTARTLARAPHGMLNLHTGWLPDYRGVKSEFWTVARGERDKLGWTLHYMTPRLDDGDIVLRRRIVSNASSLGELRALLVIDAASAIAAFIGDVRREGIGSAPRLPQSDGHYFTTPTLRDWLAARRARRW